MDEWLSTRPTAIRFILCPTPDSYPMSDSGTPAIEVVGYEPDSLYALAYVSVPTVEFTDHGLTDLLLVARRLNAISEITGKLIVLEEDDRVTRFLQWIEGPTSAVEACFERIENDPRHHKIEVGFCGEVERRRFPTWDMAIDTVASTPFAAEAKGFMRGLSRA